MLIYLILFLTAILYYLYSPSKTRKQNDIVLFFYLMGLGFFVGISDMLGGYDRYIYGAHFDSFANSVALENWQEVNWKLYNETRSSEMGFSMTYIIVSLFSMNRYIYIFCVTMLIYTLLFISFKRYVQNYPLAMILFLGLWFFFTFTYLRQVLGCSVAWLSIRYIIRRNLKMYLLIMFIAYSMHNSAIIFFPFYFLPIRKFKKDSVIWVMLSLLVIGVTNLPASFFSIYGDMMESEHRAGQYVDDYAFRYEYIAEAIVFLYFILTNYDKIERSRQNIILLNIALVFCGTLLLFCMNTQGGRLSWYFMLGLIATLSMIVKKQNRRFSDAATFIVLSFALFFRIVVGWDYLLSPYKTFLTDGYREGDLTHEEYEYNPKYDEDKFCRPAFVWYGSKNENINE